MSEDTLGPVPYTLEEITKMNEENDARQKALIADWEKEQGAKKPTPFTMQNRTISCRCGYRMTWTWTPGDHSMPEANLNKLFDELAKHQHSEQKSRRPWGKPFITHDLTFKLELVHITDGRTTRKSSSD